MKAKTVLAYILGVVCVCLAIGAAVYGPGAFLRRYDAVALGDVTLEEKDAAEGYKYAISPEEKLYVLSNALSNRIVPQSDYFAAIRSNAVLSDVRTQSYAFQAVYNQEEFNEKTRADALLTLSSQLALLSERGILPEIAFDPQSGDYDAVLYTAIDVLEPKLSATVWRISYPGVILRHGLADCVMDAQTGKVYSISLRADREWAQYDVGQIIALWAEYLGVSQPESVDAGSALTEGTPHYRKYAVRGVGEESTIVTVGYYEGIQEFFIRIAY